MDLSQRGLRPWTTENRCVLKKCGHPTPMYIPWHRGKQNEVNDLEPDVNYTGAVASRTDQVCASSIHGPVTVKEHFRKFGTHLVACSTYCLRELHAIEKQWLPFPGEPVWKTLRAAPAVDPAVWRSRHRREVRDV